MTIRRESFAVAALLLTIVVARVWTARAATDGPQAAAAFHALPGVPVKATAGPGRQIALDVMREVLLRPLVVIGKAHHVSPRAPPSCS